MIGKPISDRKLETAIIKIDRSQREMRAISRGFSILKFLGKNGEFGIPEISDAISQNKSTVYRFLRTLQNLGYVSQNADTEKYALTLKLLRLGSFARVNTRLCYLARPAIRSLAGRTRETVQLAILDACEIVCLDEIETIHSLRIISPISRTWPGHCRALGRALLAHKSDSEVHDLHDGMPLTRFTSNTITCIDALISELRTVRSEGVSVDNDEYEPGLVCVGAPVFDHTGQVVASIAVSVPIVRLWNDRIDALKEQARFAGPEISVCSGFREKPDQERYT